VELARQLVQRSGMRNIEIHQALSFGRPVDATPQVLITELLGPNGLEGNIVECMYEFALKYPSIEHFIPRRLRLFVQPVRSVALNERFLTIAKNINSASHGTFRYEDVIHVDHGIFCNLLISAAPGDATVAAAAELLAEFDLGCSPNSSFERTISFHEDCDFDFVNIYFEAELSDSVTLTSACNAPLTHWKWHFSKRPYDSRTFSIGYTARQGLRIQWRHDQAMT
jgi:hypothetical protein